MRNITLSLILTLTMAAFATPAMPEEDILTMYEYSTPPPSLLFASFLNGMTMHAETGELTFDNLWTINLPDVEEYSYQQYSPSDGGALWASITDADDEERFRLDFYGLSDEAPYHLLTHYQLTDNSTGETTGSQSFFLDEGDYFVDFFVEGDHFFHYPFTVTLVASPDPEARDDYYVLDGDWEDWSYFVYPGADPDEALLWKVWLRDTDTDSYDNHEVHAELRRDGGGVLATGREGESYNLRPGWVRAEFEMIHPSDGSLFRAKELLANDGSYRLTLELGGELYGTWNFEIDDGQFVYEDRTDRDVTDPLVFIDGGPGVFFYERE
jgi:hypothetical protein